MSEENETQSVRPGEYESSDSGAFCFCEARNVLAFPLAHFDQVRNLANY